MSINPDITCDLHFDDRNVDLVEHGFDLGIGVAINQDSHLIARPLLIQDIGIYASPEYLDKFGEPQTLEDLTHHRCIPVRSITTGRFHNWRTMQSSTNPKGSLSSITLQLLSKPH